MLSDYLAPVPYSILESFEENENDIIGRKILIHNELDGIPDLNEVDIAIIGVQEDRNSNRQHPSSKAPDVIREKFYQLYPGRWDKRIADLGNIYKGETVTDTYYALADAVAEIIKQDIVVIILGGSQDLTYANYRAYDRLEQHVNLTSIDCAFDLGRQNEKLNSESYLSHIILQQPYNLFNFCNIGYQSYYIHPDQIDLMSKMHFDSIRLGEIKKNLADAEPILRDSDVVSFDISALKSSEIKGQEFPSPHGLLNEEACAIARYSGISDKVTSFGVYNYSPMNDEDAITASLISQMVWYFIEGVEFRTGDYPYGSKSDYLKFTVLLEEEDTEMNFLKSPVSGRWWIEVPNMVGKPSHALIPCSKEDYDLAKKGEIPNRWWNAVKKTV